MFSLRNRFVMFAALVAALWGAPAHSQTSGRVSGVVRDASGGALPGATVTITNQATRASQVVTAATDGTFSASLAPGLYSVTVSLKGFTTKGQRDLKVDAGASVTADLSLVAGREEEVTVTAMRREETVQNTPVSIVAPTGADLRSRGVEGLEGLAGNVGGLTVQNTGPGQTQVAMRGVGAGQIVRDQPGVKEQVGIYLDDSVISLSLFTPDLDMFDLNRAEVLRGPQGTLFGAGSDSGTVRYITNQPELKATQGFAEFGGNSVDGGSQGGDVKLGFNAPLGDTAAARVVGYYNHIPGYIDSPGTTRTPSGAVRPDPASTNNDVNSGNRYGVRGAVKIAPNDRFTITPRLVYQKVDADGWNRFDAFNILANPFTTTRPAVTLGDREAFNQLPEKFTDKFTLADVNLSYNFGGAQLTSISSYTDRNILVIRDTTQLTASATGYDPIGLPESVYTINSPLNDYTKAKVFTEELRLSGAKNRLQWVLGGFYSHIKRDYSQQLITTGFSAASGIPTSGVVAPTDALFYSDMHFKLDQFALFGEGTLSLSDKVNLTGGLRYYHFSEDKNLVFDGIFPGYLTQDGNTSADGVAPRVILSFKLSDTTNLNAQVSKGFRLGGINDPLNLPICSAEDQATFGGAGKWKDESTWDYEVGTKSRVFGNRGALNLTAFYMDIHDLQATVTAGSCSSRLIYNVPKSRSQGLEGEFSVAPTRHFEFALSGSYHDAEFKSTVSPSSATGIVEGRRLPTVPKFEMSASATARWDMMRDAVGYLTGSVSYVGGDRYTQAGDLELGGQPNSPCGPTAAGCLDMNSSSTGNPPIGGPLTQRYFTYNPILPSYSLLNARIGVLKGKWDVSLYANNLTDERALLAFDRERGTRARIFFLTNQPRTFGLSARVHF